MTYLQTGIVVLTAVVIFTALAVIIWIAKK
jgi:hypothetical protein